ncbi:hypothetical protein CW749_00885 [Vibrio sp. vnigr-6D03]|uniref:hypothetical protein n=1 Tax=Vibrio sp. vnigr-6D03 TaxID=2058088 RepID=UPI000C328592|nr:hypothetical protein [Vibrio sp. vnigr-6D03]PKF81232.1 hypothetical protein CW749_00885 [Vibrio sp. vnigr-6D03]
MIKKTIYTLIFLAFSSACSGELKKVEEISVLEHDFQNYGQTILQLSQPSNVSVFLAKYSNKILLIDDKETKVLELEHEVSSYASNKSKVFVVDNTGQLLEITPEGDITTLLQHEDIRGRDFSISSDGELLYSRGLVIHSPFKSVEDIVKFDDLYPQFLGSSFGKKIGVTSGAMKLFADQDTWLDIWDSKTGRKITSFDTFNSYVYAPVIVDDSEGIVMFQWSERFTLWNYKSDEILSKQSMEYSLSETNKVGDIYRAYGPDNIQHLKVVDNKIVRTLLCEFKGTSIQSSPQYTMDGNHVLLEQLSGEHSRFAIYEISDKGCSKILDLPEKHHNYTLHPSNRQLLTFNSKAISIYSW